METNKKRNIYIIIAIALLFIVVGVTYALFNVTLNGDINRINSGTISFNYIEEENGLSITNTSTLTDNQEQQSENYFEFSVTGSANGIVDVGYYIYLDTLNYGEYNNRVKVSLSSVNDPTDPIGNETAVIEPIFVSNLVSFNTNTFRFDDNSYNMQLHNDTFNFTNDPSDDSQTKYYRFRMWTNYSNNTQTNPDSTTHQITTVPFQYRLTVNIIAIDGVANIIEF